jgi:ribosome-binding factor A
MSFRRIKMQDAIRDELSAIISRELGDPRLTFVSVTAVELAQDMAFAKVFISSFKKEPEATDSAVEALESAKGRIRGEVGRRLSMRHAPELSFRPDHSMERAAKVLEILNEIKTGTEEPE